MKIKSKMTKSGLLTPKEVERLSRAAAKRGRNRVRDELIIRLMYGHALRLIETTELSWQQIDLEKGIIRVIRRRGGIARDRRLSQREMELLRELTSEQLSNHVFWSERDAGLSSDAVRKMIKAAAEEANLNCRVVPRTLRKSAAANVGRSTRDLSQVKDLLGVAQSSSAAFSIPDKKPAQQPDPWK